MTAEPPRGSRSRQIIRLKAAGLGSLVPAVDRDKPQQLGMSVEVITSDYESLLEILGSVVVVSQTAVIEALLKEGSAVVPVPVVDEDADAAVISALKLKLHSDFARNLAAREASLRRSGSSNSREITRRERSGVVNNILNLIITIDFNKIK